MRKSIKYVSLGLITALVSCMSTGYFVYQPTYLRNKAYVSTPDSLSALHIENIQRVFRYYDVPYKFENGKIYVKRKISEEMMQIYTAKASDKKWIREH